MKEEIEKTQGPEAVTTGTEKRSLPQQVYGWLHYQIVSKAILAVYAICAFVVALFGVCMACAGWVLKMIFSVVYFCYLIVREIYRQCTKKKFVANAGNNYKINLN